MAGERCRGTFCACRPLLGGDQEETQPPPHGAKRFEFRIPTTVHPVWIHIDGVGTLYKGPDQGEEICAYVDLTPGEYEVTYMTKERNRYEGFPAMLRIFEYGKKTRAWYETFTIDCGVSDGVCTKGSIKEWAQGVETKKGIFDPCSSTRFKNVRYASNEWEGGRLEELSVKVRLKVYRFEPSRPPQSFCQGRASRGSGESEDGDAEKGETAP